MVSDLALMGSLMALMGLGFSGWAVTKHRTQRALLAETRTVPGKIHEVGMRCGQESYHPQVSYTYEFEGETYESETIYPGSTPTTERTSAAVQQLYDEYGIEEGARTTVFVNPEHPGEGFLADEANTMTSVLFGVVGFGLVCLGTYLFVHGVGLVAP